MTTITIERAKLEEWLDRFQSSIHAGDTSLAALEAEQMFRSALAAPATAPKHRTVSDDLIACLRGGRQCDADGVEVIMSRQACREAADILESWAIDQAPATAPSWHDAPNAPGLWVCRQAITDNVQAYEVTDQMALNRNLKLKGQWYGPIPEDKP